MSYQKFNQENLTPLTIEEAVIISGGGIPWELWRRAVQWSYAIAEAASEFADGVVEGWKAADQELKK